MYHPELPIGAFFAAVLVLIPAPWHWRARSIPTLSIIAWLFLDNLIIATNSIIWSGNVRIIAPVWCDISVRVQYASTLALPASCLCLTMRLERISSARTVSTTAASKRKWTWFDITMCWILPLIYLSLYYIVQGHRFDIVEDLGCRFTYYVSVAGLFLVVLPPLVLSFLTLLFAGLSLAHFFRRRLDFNRHLAKSGSALTTARYVRLMLMSTFLMIWVLAVTLADVIFSSSPGLRPWISWDNVHSNWSQIGQFPAALISSSNKRWLFVLWWTVPISAYINAAFFILGENTLKEYRLWIWAKKVFHWKPAQKTRTTASRYVHTLDDLPSARKTKRDSFAFYPEDTKSEETSMSKPILSQAALRSFAASNNSYRMSSSTSVEPPSPSDEGLLPAYNHDRVTVSLHAHTHRMA